MFLMDEDQIIADNVGKTKEDILLSKIDKVVELIEKSNNTIILSGAGLSTASGIPDFRSQEGLYSKYPEEVLSRYYFYNKTDKFYEAFNDKFSSILTAKPNEAHKLIAKWQSEGIVDTICTQNIDDLHFKAIDLLNISDYRKRELKSEICEMHGSIRTFTMPTEEGIHTLKLKDVLKEDGTIEYRRRGEGKDYDYLVKPNIVLYGEEPVGYYEMSQIVNQKADLMIVLGTSLEVYPFAYLPGFMRKGKYVVIINKSPIKLQQGYTIEINEDITEMLSIIDKKLKDNR